MVDRPASRKVPSRWSVLLEAFIVFVACGIVYLSTLAGNHTEAEDGLRYLNDIQSGNPAAIFSPYHIAYGWAGWATYHTAALLGYGGGPLLPVQVLNALTGAFGAASLWVFLRGITLSRAAAAVGCGVLAFSYGYWWYSVEVEVYILSVVLLMFSLFLAYRAAMRPSWRTFALLGAVQGLAVLAHNTNVLFASVVLTSLLLAWRALRLRELAALALVYGGALLGVVIPIYALAISSVGLSNPQQVYDWLTEYAQRGTWGSWDVLTLPKAVIGVGRALIGGHFVLSFDSVTSFATNVLPNQSLREEIFLVRNFDQTLAVSLLVLIVVFAVVSLVPIISWVRRPTLDRSRKTLTILCLSWLLSYALFFAWWEPDNMEFWIAAWVPLAILLALPFSVPDYGVERSRLLSSMPSILVGTLFIINLSGSVALQHDEANDYWRVRATWYELNATHSDLVVANDYIWRNYLNYFTGAKVINSEVLLDHQDDPNGAVEELRHRADATSARRVLLSSDALYSSSDRFSRCYDRVLCEQAAVLRKQTLPYTRVVSDKPLEDVRELSARR